MVTFHPHQVTSRESRERSDDTHRTEDGLATRVLNHVRQSCCGLHGHDSLLQFERERMFLKCVSCGHESPGWALDKTPRIVKARDETRRPSLSPHLVGARRIA
jgi:hypothetical protein